MDQSRFAEEAMATGVLTPAQIDRVLAVQAADLNAGHVPRPVGIICLELGWLTYDQVVDLLARARRAYGRRRETRFRPAALLH